MPILALALCLASGYLLTATAWPRRKPSLSELLMELSLSAGFGLGIFSVVFLVVRPLGLTRLIAVDIGLPLLLLVGYCFRRSPAVLAPPGREYEDFDPPPWVRRILTASFLIAVLAAVYNAVLRSIAHPHGDGWDAFSIWNLHARFLFLGGDHWRDGFSSMIPWSHPDYPLLLPAAIAHFWAYLRHDNPVVPALVGLILTFSTLALLVSSLAVLRGSVAAMLAGLMLSSTPFFVEHGTSQYADVPLSFFILASLVLLHLSGGSLENHHGPHGSLLLSGLAAGFAAWTKNEGLLFLFALVLAQSWIFALRPFRDRSHGQCSRNWTGMAPFLLGAAPVLVMVVWFEHSVATAGDLFSTPGIMLDKVLTPGRYWTILQWFAKEFLRFGNWWIVPGTVAMLAFELLNRGKRCPGREPGFLVSAISLGLMLTGYFAIYVITPRDLYWHLRFSLNRLFLQLWPSAIFLFFLFAGGQTSPTYEK